MATYNNDRVFDTSGVMDTIVDLQRAYPREDINLVNVAMKTLSGIDKEKFVNEMEKCAYKFLSKKGKLDDCKNYVHVEDKKYKLFGSPEYVDMVGYDHFIGSFYTIEEAIEYAEKHAKANMEYSQYQIVANDVILRRAVPDEDTGEDIFKWEIENEEN